METIEELKEKYKDDELLSSLLNINNNYTTDEKNEIERVEEQGIEERFKEDTESNNSITLTSENSRFTGAKWFSGASKLRIYLFGVGGIGSWTALLINRLSVFSINIYDFDTVEEANMSGQLYGANSIGLNKVDAMAELLSNLGIQTTFVKSINTECNSFDLEPDVFISGLDNMNARKKYFNMFKEHTKYLKTTETHSDKECLFIDGRLSPNVLQIFAFSNKQEDAMKEYEEKYLFDSSEAVHEACSFKQTSYMAAMIGSLITNIVVNWTFNKGQAIPLVTVPFLTSYNSEYMEFNIFNNFNEIK